MSGVKPEDSLEIRVFKDDNVQIKKMNNLKIKEVEGLIADAKSFNENEAEYFLTSQVLNLLYAKNKERFIQFFVELNQIEKDDYKSQINDLKTGIIYSTPMLLKQMAKKPKWEDNEFLQLVYSIAPHFIGYKNNPLWYSNDQKYFDRLQSEFRLRDERFKDTIRKNVNEDFYCILIGKIFDINIQR